jgi:hypothetical protein
MYRDRGRDGGHDESAGPSSMNAAGCGPVDVQVEVFVRGVQDCRMT